MEIENRKLLLEKVKLNMDKLSAKLNSPTNYKNFFHFKQLKLYGFGTEDEIKLAKQAAILSYRHRSNLKQRSPSNS